jgi:hypothetical protein
MPSVAGRFFLEYLKANHTDIAKDPNFMKFKIDRKNVWSAHKYFFYLNNLWFISNTINYFVNKYKCSNFDEWYAKMIANKSDALPKFYNILYNISNLLVLIGLLNLAIPFIPTKIYECFYKSNK